MFRDQGNEESTIKARLIRTIKRNEEGVIKTHEKEGAIKGKREQLRWRRKEGPPGLTSGDQWHRLFNKMYEKLYGLVLNGCLYTV